MGVTGYIGSMAHVDFYPNNGVSPQPGCEYINPCAKCKLKNRFTSINSF
jgi:hypothetical protein